MRLGAVAPARIPLTVVGGFLGAGKTTFLNNLLARAQGRTAVLVNDFGAVNVDAGLIADHDGRTLRLTNGCVCCSLADGFLDTLLRVLSEPFDAIVIEASGVGDPWAIAEIALIEPTLRLGAVVVLADAERTPMLLADPRVGDTVRRQIEAADLVILNKADLVDAPARDRARAALRRCKANIRIIEAVFADVPADLVAPEIPGPLGPKRRAVAADHEDDFRRLLYRRDRPFDEAALRRVLTMLPTALLRLKGEVELGDRGARHLLQMVGTRVDLTPLAQAGASAHTELAGIGTRDLNAPAVASLLDTALIAATDQTEPVAATDQTEPV